MDDFCLKCVDKLSFGDKINSKVSFNLSQASAGTASSHGWVFFASSHLATIQVKIFERRHPQIALQIFHSPITLQDFLLHLKSLLISHSEIRWIRNSLTSRLSVTTVVMMSQFHTDSIGRKRRDDCCCLRLRIERKTNLKSFHSIKLLGKSDFFYLIYSELKQRWKKIIVVTDPIFISKL